MSSLPSLLTPSFSTILVQTAHLVLWTTRALLLRDPLNLPCSLVPAVQQLISNSISESVGVLWASSSLTLSTWTDLFLLTIATVLSRGLRSSSNDQMPVGGLLLSSMIDILSAESPSLQYLSLTSQSPKQTVVPPQFVPHPGSAQYASWKSQIEERFLREDYLSCLLSANESLSSILITVSATTRLSILLTVLGSLSSVSSSSSLEREQEVFRYSLHGLEIRSDDLTCSDQQLQLGLSSELLLLKVRYRSLSRLEELLNKYRDSPSTFSSLAAPHLASIIPALLQVSLSLSLS
jgi:hypothetical protein